MKLIRDKIPELIENTGCKDGNVVIHHHPDNLSILEGLKAKALEEVQEFQTELGTLIDSGLEGDDFEIVKTRLIEEAADVFEVLITTIQLMNTNLPVNTLLNAASQKRKDLGGFNNGYFYEKAK